MRSANLPLASYCHNNFEAMHHRLSSVLKPHRLRRLSNVPVSGIICRATLKRVSINLMRIGPSVDVWPGALEDFYLVQIPILGAVQISFGEDRIRCEGAMAAVISPGERLRLRWSDNCAQLIVQIPREIMEARLAEPIGCKRRTPLRFEPAFDLRRSAAHDWRVLLDFTVRSIDQDGLFSREPLGAALEDLLLSRLLATQPHSHSGELHEVRGPLPYYVLRAEREMCRRLAAPLTIARLAEVAGVSERTLYDGFRRFCATTPMARLTTLRLKAARGRLQEAEPGMTVGRAAAEAGIFQFGRFAGSYRQAFGELPSVTLRAGRRRRS